MIQSLVWLENRLERLVSRGFRRILRFLRNLFCCQASFSVSLAYCPQVYLNLGRLKAKWDYQLLAVGHQMNDRPELDMLQVDSLTLVHMMERRMKLNKVPPELVVDTRAKRSMGMDFEVHMPMNKLVRNLVPSKMEQLVRMSVAIDKLEQVLEPNKMKL